MRIAEYKQVDTNTITEQVPILDEEGMETGEFETVTREVPVMQMVYRDMTAEEEAEALAQQAEAERQAFEAEMAQQGSIENRLALFVESIPIDPLPRIADRPGYRWKQMYDAQRNAFGWEEVADPYYVPKADGSYINPIQWLDGEQVTADMFYWYDDYDLRKMALADGVPAAWTDAEFFEQF